MSKTRTKKKAKAQRRVPRQPAERPFDKAMREAPRVDVSPIEGTPVGPQEAQPVTKPSGIAECTIWRRRDVRTRVFRAIARWAQIPVGELTPGMTLAGLARGAPWGLGQQANLVQATNLERPFEPFEATMDPPPGLAPGSTTVSQWEQLVWQRQTPRTPCFGLA